MYCYSRKVQYHETDKMGITHHSNYIKWMEEARVEFLESIGLPFQEIEKEGIVSPVVNLSVDYKKPSFFGDMILIETKAEKYNGFLFDISYTMKESKKGEIIAEAHSGHCFIKNGRVTSLKKTNPSMHEILQAAFENDLKYNYMFAKKIGIA